jgi:hypothetical protein
MAPLNKTGRDSANSLLRSRSYRSLSEKPARVRQDLAEFRIKVVECNGGWELCQSGCDSASSSLRSQSCRSLS